MVKRATETQSREWAALPSSTEMAFRRISSVLLMGGFLTIITPFSPFTWLIPSQGPDLLDQFIGPVLLLGALFFQWRIAGVVGGLPIRIMDNGFVYHHSMYWRAALTEVALCVAVHWGQNEIWRRFVAVGLTAGLWLIGWACTPREYKETAWEHIKWIWTMMAFDHARRVVGGGRRRW